MKNVRPLFQSLSGAHDGLLSLFTNIAFVIQICDSKAIESFVSRTNARLVGTLISIRDVSVSIATKIVSK